MPDRPLKLHDLRRILRSFGVEEDTSRGKGSHTMFYKQFPDGLRHYPVPTHGNEVIRQ
jgi:predicted RNA binding protein YcfA (HicA-like mRNA interferase family)